MRSKTEPTGNPWCSVFDRIKAVIFPRYTGLARQECYCLNHDCFASLIFNFVSRSKRKPLDLFVDQ